MKKKELKQKKITHGNHESDELISKIDTLKNVIGAAGLTDEDVALFKARVDAANAKILATQQALDAAENDRIKSEEYANLRVEIEAQTVAYELLVNADLSTQELVDAANKAGAKINTTDLDAKDANVFNARIDAGNIKISQAQKIIDDAVVYAALKAEMEAKIAAVESLANASLLEIAREKDAKKDLDEYEIESKKSENLETPVLRMTRGNAFTALFLFLVLASFIVSSQRNSATKSDVALKDKTEKYIKENLVKPGTDLKISDFVREGDLYKLTITVGGQNVVAYVTGDGKKLLLNPIDLDKSGDNANASNSSDQAKASAPVAEASTKKDVPEVELFVMSQCPYGVQAEKGILPVIQKLGSKINFSVKFVDYTLHGKKEFDENLNQYCIQKEDPTKYNDYLACYVKSGDASACAATAKLDDTKIASCIADTDKQFKLTENFSASAQSSPFNIYKDLNDKYGVQGSPSLVVNGQLIDAGRDSASLLKTICSGFSSQPEECKADLSSASPTPGFGS